MVTEQLTLRFGWGDDFSFGNYYPAGNEAALHCIQQLASEKGEQFIFLWGAQGSGKSHVLQAACQSAAQAGHAVAYLPLEELADFEVGIFEGLEQLSLVCIDDLQLIAGRDGWEEALFHLYNRLRESGGRLVLAASMSPAALPVVLEDLCSRLSWGPVFQLNQLDENGKIEALRMHAAARSFDLPEEVALFLMRRSVRDMASLFALLDKLDKASLAQHRKLTIPFVRTLI